MGVILDTSILIAAEKRLIDFSQWEKCELAYISSITVTELLIGVDRASTPGIRAKRSAFVEHIINSISNINFGEEEARCYARIIDDLYKQNITLGVHDMLIGATAIANGYPLLTLNEKDSKRIPGLEVLSMEKNK